MKNIYRSRVLLLFGSLLLSGCMGLLQPPQKEITPTQEALQIDETDIRTHRIPLSLQEMEEQLSEAAKALESNDPGSDLEFQSFPLSLEQ